MTGNPTDEAVAALKKRFPDFGDFIDENRPFLTSLAGSATPSETRNGSKTASPSTTLTTSETYELKEKIGFGGFKDVFRAQQKSTEQFVALKLLKADRVSSQSCRQLKSEVVLQAQLTHPNIPQILSYEDSQVTAPILVERLIADGKSWRSLLDDLSLEENLAILIAVSRIVAYAHERRRIVHCDLKPENVMLGENNGRYNDIYLVDWGLALWLDDPNLAEKTVGGTDHYRAPETCLQDATAITCATDVFTLGGILFRLLASCAPYQEACRQKGKLRASLVDIPSANVPEIPERCPKTGAVNPPELVEIARKALRKAPEERYANAAEFADALERYRRRASLGERFRAAQDSFERLRREIENAPHLSTTRKFASLFTGRSGAFDATRLIQTTNELRLLREETARSDGDEQRSQLFWDAVAAERAAYAVFCDSTLKSNDLGVARSLIASAETLEKSVRPSRPETDPDALDVRKFRVGLKRKLFLNFVQRCAVVFVVLASILAFRANAKKNAALAEAESARADLDVARIQAIEQAVAPVADAKWSQGEVALRDFLKEPALVATSQSLAERSGIFLEAAGPRRFIVDSVAFSADENYFATLGRAVNIFALDANGKDVFAAVAQFPVDDYDGTRRLVANPAFVAETEADPKLASRFLLCRDDGVVFFLRFDQTGAISTTQADFRASEPTQNRVPWGAPRFAESDDGAPLLVVADASGAASFYSFPDGRLLRKVQLCDAGGGAVPVVKTTSDGRTLFCAAPDGSFRRWSAETDAVETLDLPLSADADLSYGALLRSLEISADGQTLYAADESGEFVVWDVAVGKPIYVGREPADPAQNKRLDAPSTLNHIAGVYRLDADRFLTLGFNDRWRVWDLSKRDENGVPTSVELRDANAKPSRLPRAVDVSPSRRFLAVSENSHNFAIYDLERRRAIARSEGLFASRLPDASAACSLYVPQFDRVVVGTFDYSPLMSFDPTTLRVETEYEPYPDPQSSFVQAGNALASSFVIPETGDEFAAAFSSGDVFFFQNGVPEPTGKLENAFDRSNFADDTSNLPALAASPGGSFLLGKSIYKTEFILWDWKTRAEIRRWNAPAPTPASGLELTFGGLTLGLEFINETEALELRGDGSIARYNVETGELIATIPVSRPVAADSQTFFLSSYALSSDRRRLALGFSDGLLEIFDLETERVLFSSAEFAKPLPKRRDGDADPLEYPGFDYSRLATGFAWSRDDALLCVALGSGQTILLETRRFTPLETFVVADEGVGPSGRLCVEPYFTRSDKLLTVDSRGFLKRWDFRPSPEKPTILEAKRGAKRVDGASRPNVWASVDKSTFVVKDGDQELCKRDFVEWFQRLTEPNAPRETFLLLGRDGLLSTIDETGASVETGVDWNRGAPGATPERLAILEQAKRERAARQGTTPTVSPKIQTEIERLTEENSSQDSGEERVTAQIDALFLSPITPEEILTLGFTRVAVAPNHRAFAAIGKDDALYVLTLAEADAGWRLAARPQEEDATFSNLAFRPDSRELAALETNGGVAFVPFDAAPGAPDDVVWSQKAFFTDQTGRVNHVATPTIPPLARATRRTNALIRLHVDDRRVRLLVQRSFRYVWIWDVATRNLAQTIELDFYDKMRLDSISVSGLAPLRLSDDAEAFVVAGKDGVLRFYRYDAATQMFALVYATSQKTLSDFIRSAERVKLQNKFFSGRKSSLAGRNPLFWRFSRQVDDLSVSDSQKTLYVGASDSVYAFDLDEIRRNIEELPRYWRDFDAQSVTSLRYAPGVGFEFIERDRLVPVDAKP